MSKFQQFVDFFVKHPKLHDKSSGKFINGSFGKGLFSDASPEVIKKAKAEAKLKLKEGAPEDEVNISGNLDDGSFTSTITVDYLPKDDIEMAALHKVNLEKYRITNYYSKMSFQGKFRHTVQCRLLSENKEEFLQKNFIDFLATYTPKAYPVPPIVEEEYRDYDEPSCLIIPKQDAHFDKYDIYGDNNINVRFKKSYDLLHKHLKKAFFGSDLEEVVYLIGGDQFNAEATGLTTKGTPQKNMTPYEEGFQAICDHEVNCINLMLSMSKKVNIIYVPGNHDHYVGWHCINWLQCYFRELKDSISFSIDSSCTKYYRYKNTAIMFNHGDAIKFKDLAIEFPIGFKKEWSSCEHFYVLTGDKHTEHSKDIGGIRVHQVPQLGSAKSSWDDKQGYSSGKGELQSFLINNLDGITDIYKDKLK